MRSANPRGHRPPHPQREWHSTEAGRVTYLDLIVALLVVAAIAELVLLWLIDRKLP